MNKKLKTKYKSTEKESRPEHRSGKISEEERPIEGLCVENELNRCAGANPKEYHEK
jgi:hypothetical protein